MNNEIWKPYPMDNRYQVSNLGNIKGPKGTILKGTQTKAGYKKVGLYTNGKGTFKYVHRMVLETFLPNKESNILEVNHKDGNKENNTLENLEWVTGTENKIHARDYLKINYSTQAAHEARKQKIKMIDINTNEEQIFNSINECANFLQVTYQTLQYYIKTGKPYYKKQKKFEKLT